VSHAFEPLDEVPFAALGIESIEIISAEVLVGALGFKQIVGDEQDVRGADKNPKKFPSHLTRT
jgi:hypothetical protein